MSLGIVFEDNETSYLGSLLKETYNSSNLYFSRSNTRIYSKVKLIYDKYDSIIVFFDLVPNNEFLMPVLKDLCKKLALFDIERKVHIVPIVCSEYIYLKAFVTYLNKDIIGFNLNNSINYHKSCEKYYKKLLNDNIFKNSINAEHFYCSYPVFDIIDKNHEDFICSLGIETRDTSFKLIDEKVTNFYEYFYNLFNKNFSSDILSNCEIHLF